MYCANCGKRIPSDSKFCLRCGGSASGGGASAKKNGAKPRRSRALKILGYFAAFFAVFIIVPLVVYLFGVYHFKQQEIYKHLAVGFSINYPKYLKMETPTLPSEAKCKVAAPCFLLFKNPSYSDYVVNWVFVLSATDAGVKKDVFLSEMEKAFQVDIDKGEATTQMIGNKKVYKYANDPAKSSQSLTVFYQMLKFDASLEQSLYAFASGGDSVVLIGFRKPPPGVSSEYNGYLNIKSLVIP